MRRIGRFIKAMWRYVLYGKNVSIGEYVERLDKCVGCQYLNKDKWTCGKCGCYLIKKAKMSTEKCPDNKW